MEDLADLLQHIPDKYQEVIKTQLQEVFSEDRDLIVLQGQANQRYLNQHGLVKAMSEKWSEDGLKAVSYKINPMRGRGDDEVYQQHPKLQQILPRGLTYVNGEMTIFAFPKFFGLRDGDDDDNHLTTPVDTEVTQFMVTLKANGEMAQIYWYAPSDPKIEPGWIIGSKNRKLFARQISDLVKYDNMSEYQFARIIAAEFFSILDRTPSNRVEILKNFLAASHLTLIWELENTTSQHIEPLRENRLVLVALTGVNYPKGLHPAFTYAWSVFLGDLPCVLKKPLKTFLITQLDQICRQISQVWEKEGAVLYLLDSQCHVIQMVKVKAWWYILLRAIREKFRSNLKTGSAILCQNQIRKRLTDIHLQLNVDFEWCQQFITLGSVFATWFFKQYNANNEKMLVEFSERYPLLWLRFLEDNNLPDNKSLMKVDLSQFDALVGEELKPALLVMFQGIPGLGKNYLGDQLKERLRQEGIQCEVVAQDDFSHLGTQKSGQVCFDYVQKRIYSGEIDVLFLARNNSNRKQYKRYLNFPRYLFLAPSEMATKKHELLALGIAAVLERKNTGQMHPTDELSDLTLASLPFRFGTDFSYFPQAYRIDFLNDHAKLDPISSELIDQEMSRFQKFKKNVFSAKNISKEVFTKIDYTQALQFRRPIQDLVRDCLIAIHQGLKNFVPADGKYIGIVLDDQSRERLTDLLEKYPGRTIAHHVTLMHCHDFHRNPSHWIELHQKLGMNEQMTITRIKYAPGRLTTAETKLDFLQDDVFSKVPHLTMKLEKSRAVQSIDVLKDGKIPWIELDKTIQLQGIVSLLP